MFLRDVKYKETVAYPRHFLSFASSCGTKLLLNTAKVIRSADLASNCIEGKTLDTGVRYTLARCLVTAQSAYPY